MTSYAMFSLFFVISIVVTVQTETCPANRFGPGCRYMCHCKTSTDCIGGDCPDGCDAEWFGPKCQYANMIKKIKSDGCLQISNGALSYKHKWDYSYIFTWMRIELKQLGHPRDVNVTFQNKTDVVNCKDPIFTVINNKTFDLHCTDLDLLIDSLDINVFNQKQLCTVEVSGGRNIAFNQTTNQTGFFDFGTSEKAVDGNRNSEWKDKSCTHTTDVTYPAIASWRVDFDKPFFVNRYFLYNRNENKDRLANFTLHSYSPKGDNIFVYKNLVGEIKDIYTIPSNLTNLISFVNISKTPAVMKENILTLCEVEIFGDNDCQDKHKFGLECNETCNCFNQSENCLVSTGGCPSGCAAGYTGEGCATSCDSGTYGKDCSFSCNPNCLKDTCDSKTGHCIDGCIDGYTTPFCNESCSLGTYGQHCSENCSANCINETCSPVNGSCDCKPGFQGNTCDQECNPGSYGNHCNQNCSANCINNCSTVDGSCKCKPGFQGNHCNRDCDLGYYGDQCSLQCFTNCINSSCNNINGSCSCVSGYTGDKCDQECPEHTYGDNCLENCNQTCLNTVCNNINGRCKNGCIPGKEGDFCQFDCQSGKYGKNCKEDCSVTCGGNGLCHQVFGNCSEGCQDGFKGDMCSEAISADEDQSNDAAVAIPIVLVILIIVAILLGAIFWRRRKAKKAAHAQEGNLQKLTNVAAEDNQLARIEVETDSKVNNDVEYYNTALEIADTRVPVDKLHNYLRTHNKAFFEEQFLKIHTSTNSPTHIGSLAENKLKNRYKNILPYDHCRVHLSINTEKKHGDYINASFVKSYKKNEKFIASQGPNKVILEDFVRMLWEQKIDKVVMLTNLVEEAKQKCEQYWPKEGDEEIGQFRLRLINTDVFADCVIRKLEISVTGEATHNVTQYHFTSWPDKGVPATAWSLVDFEQRVSFHLTQRPIVVHCSAGVGRTGTFIALHNVMCQAEDTGYIDFFQTLSKLRIDRMLMIQTAEQYLFLHKAALVAMLCINTTVHQNDIGEHLKQLETKLVSGETLFEKEFKAICDVCAENHDEDDDEGSGGSASSTYLNSRSVNNRAKNRFSNILSKDSYRPFLHSDNKEYGDYINAVALPSFTRLNQQYLTQLPLPSTVIDFWRLVTQMKVSLIIAFDLDLQDTDTTIGNYLPSSKGQQQHFGPVIVETLNSIKDESWEELTLTATIHKKRKKLSTSSTHNEETTVTHLKFTGNVHDGEKLLKFISYARSHSAQRVGKVVYTCRNGADLSGLACVLSLLLDRMDHDHHITVPLVVGALKTVRPQIIPTLVQYKLLYSILQQYSQCNNIYGNVASANVSTQSRNQKEEDNNIYANS